MAEILRNAKKVLITGGTGMVGKKLVEMLTGKGYEVAVLTRNTDKHPSQPSVTYYNWDFEKEFIDERALDDIDAIIHLAGSGVMDKRWNNAYRNEILKSRTASISFLLQKLQKRNHSVKTLVSASAIGWYGPDFKQDYAFTEEYPASNHFLGNTCKLWEESAEQAESLGIRVCKLRIGIVLSNKGGALPEFIKPIKMGIAAIFGNGKQMVSWIHVEDLCRMFLFALAHENIRGSYNAVAPVPSNNKNLVITLATILKGRFWIPLFVPSLLLKCLLGERSIELLKSTTVSSSKISAAGFTFLYPEISQALKKILKP